MDPTLDVLHTALNGLMTRQSVLANNIANASTPGFQASQVDFETALRQAMANGTNPPADAATIAPTNAVSNQDGNNENLDSDTLSLAETGLRYQAIVNAVNGKFSILKTAIEG
jgi:flagellar basal-body rod protein FlgB